MTNPQGTWLGDKSHFKKVSRREFLYVGLIGGLGLTLGDFFKLRAAELAAGTAGKAPAKSIIHIFLPGGLSAQESFDPKPLTPIEYRGPFSPIDTKLPGVQFSSFLKDTAKIADKLTICRSITHGEAAHERGTHTMFTGYKPSTAIQYPSYGSVVAHELGSPNELPPYICIPGQPNEFAGSGYLSTAHGPFSLGGDPADKQFQVRDLTMAKGIDEARFARRQSLLATVDDHFRGMEESDALDAMDSFYQRAYGLVSSQSAREAFNMEAEPAAIREEYGRTQAGQRMLMARRLVEAGVPFVSMSYGGWDHHKDIRKEVEKQLPQFDQAYATLIRDLDRRGLLDTTLVMLTTEFGRTPKINKDAGRDHYPRVFSVVLAGGSIKRGHVHGSSDATGAEPDESPLSVPDLSATIYSQIGIDPAKKLMSPGGRPIDIVRAGSVVRELLA